MQGCQWSPDSLIHQDSSQSSEQHSTENFQFVAKGIVTWTQICGVCHQDTSLPCHVGSSTKNIALLWCAELWLESHYKDIQKGISETMGKKWVQRRQVSDHSRALVIHCCKVRPLKHSGLRQFTTTAHPGAGEPPVARSHSCLCATSVGSVRCVHWLSMKLIHRRESGAGCELEA